MRQINLGVWVQLSKILSRVSTNLDFLTNLVTMNIEGCRPCVGICCSGPPDSHIQDQSQHMSRIWRSLGTSDSTVALCLQQGLLYCSCHKAQIAKSNSSTLWYIFHWACSERLWLVNVLQYIHIYSINMGKLSLGNWTFMQWPWAHIPYMQRPSIGGLLNTFCCGPGLSCGVFWGSFVPLSIQPPVLGSPSEGLGADLLTHRWQIPLFWTAAMMREQRRGNGGEDVERERWKWRKEGRRTQRSGTSDPPRPGLSSPLSSQLLRSSTSIALSLRTRLFHFNKANPS